MSISTDSEVPPSTSSGLSPQALQNRHAARQGSKHEVHDTGTRPALKRLRKLSDIQRVTQQAVPKYADTCVPSSGQKPARTPQICTSAEPKTSAHAHASQAKPSGHQDGNSQPRKAGQKGAPDKQRQRAHAPRHLADPLSSKPLVARKRNVSEVLNLFKGKVSQALAQRKHLKPARLKVSQGAEIQKKVMHRQQKPHAHVSTGRAAAADVAAVHTTKQVGREDAQRCEAEALREQHFYHHDDYQDLNLHGDVAQGPEEVTEVDQPAKGKALQAPDPAGAGQQGTARGGAHTCASIAQCSPSKQGDKEDCQPRVQMSAVPPEQYAQHLKSFLLHRFCQSSGLSEDQARHPETLQQGIASLVSALGCTANRSGTAATKTEEGIKHGCKVAVEGMAAPARTVQHIHPCKPRQQLYTTALPAASKGRAPSDSRFFRPDPAGRREERALSQGMEAPAYLWQQQDVDQSALMGIQDVSLNLAGDLEAGIHSLTAPDLGRDDCLDDWMDGINSPGPLQNIVHQDNNQDSMLCMHSMTSTSPEVLTEEADVAGMSPPPGAQTLGVLPSSSPRLEHAFQQLIADSLQDELLDADDCTETCLEQACPNYLGPAPEGVNLLEEMSKAAEAQLKAHELSDLQQLKMHRKMNNVAPGLEEDDAAWLHNTEDLQGGCSEFIADCGLLSDKDVDDPVRRARYDRLMHVSSNNSSRQTEANPDPVAAFSAFCKSLAM